jgi:hypothetical protein
MSNVNSALQVELRQTIFIYVEPLRHNSPTLVEKNVPDDDA